MRQRYPWVAPFVLGPNMEEGATLIELQPGTKCTVVLWLDEGGMISRFIGSGFMVERFQICGDILSPRGPLPLEHLNALCPLPVQVSDRVVADIVSTSVFVSMISFSAAMEHLDPLARKE